jgi:hypothetical protein
MQNDDIEMYRAAATKAVSDAFAAGRLQGIAEERSRLKALIDADLGSSLASPRQVRRNLPRQYGNVIAAVRPVLRDYGDEIDASGLAELIGSDVTAKQCRNALRQLVRRGEATTTTRGKFLWQGSSESVPAGKPGAETPGSFSLAAE